MQNQLVKATADLHFVSVITLCMPYCKKCHVDNNDQSPTVTCEEKFSERQLSQVLSCFQQVQLSREDLTVPLLQFLFEELSVCRAFGRVVRLKTNSLNIDPTFTILVAFRYLQPQHSWTLRNYKMSWS